MLVRSGWVDITPTKPIPLAGSQYPTSNFERILSPIEANIVILQTNEQRVILISLDVLFIGQSLKEDIISKMDGLVEPRELCLWASHNHYAPQLDSDKPILGSYDDKYSQYVSDLISKSIIRLLNDKPSEGILSYGCSENDLLTINRRRCGLYFEEKSVMLIPHWGNTILPNEHNYRDGKISTISIRDLNGEPLALIWSFACHPVSSPGNNAVRADYPGEIRRMLRTQMGNEIPVVFLQGFSGDLKPPSFAKVPKNSGYKKLVFYHIMNIINGKEFDHFDELDWSRYVASLWDSTKAAIENPRLLELEPVLELKTNDVPLKKLGLNKNKSLRMCSLKIGIVRIIAFSAEPVAEWGPIIERIFPNDTLITTGCFEDVSCYLPVDKMVDEGGYEVEHFMERFNISGHFRFDVEKEIISYIIELK